jgi:hypothetical protein
MNRLLTRENMLAFGLFVLIMLLIVVTTDARPGFIYVPF